MIKVDVMITCHTQNSAMCVTPLSGLVQELFSNQEAETRRSFLTNSVGQDKSTNTGRKEKSLDGRMRIKFILGGYYRMPKEDTLTMLAHTMSKELMITVLVKL